MLVLAPKVCGEAIVQRSAKVCAPGLGNFITAVAYHFCPTLPAAFTQHGASTLANLCTRVAVSAGGERSMNSNPYNLHGLE